MKKIYLLFLLAIAFSFNQINAQEPCAPSGSADADGNTIYLIYTAGTSDCGDRPTIIMVGTSEFTLQAPCLEVLSIYELTDGLEISPSDPFTIDDGFLTSCTYNNTVLPVEEYEFLNATFKVYPNPLTKDSQLNVKFATNITAKIYIYDVTGKLAVTDEIDNVNSKRINTSTLTNGIYFLRLVTDNVTITKKVIIMK